MLVKIDLPRLWGVGDDNFDDAKGIIDARLSKIAATVGVNLLPDAYRLVGAALVCIATTCDVEIVLYKSACRCWFSMYEVTCGVDTYSRHVRDTHRSRRMHKPGIVMAMEWAISKTDNVFASRLNRALQMRGTILPEKYAEVGAGPPGEYAPYAEREFALMGGAINAAPDSAFGFARIIKGVGVSFSSVLKVARLVLEDKSLEKILQDFDVGERSLVDAYEKSASPFGVTDRQKKYALQSAYPEEAAAIFNGRSAMCHAQDRMLINSLVSKTLNPSPPPTPLQQTMLDDSHTTASRRGWVCPRGVLCVVECAVGGVNVYCYDPHHATKIETAAAGWARLSRWFNTVGESVIDGFGLPEQNQTAPGLPHIIVPSWFVPDVGISEMMRTDAVFDDEAFNPSKVTGDIRHSRLLQVWFLQLRAAKKMFGRIKSRVSNKPDFIKYRTLTRHDLREKYGEAIFSQYAVYLEWMTVAEFSGTGAPSKESAAFFREMKPYMPLVEWYVERKRWFPGFTYPDGDVWKYAPRRISAAEKARVSECVGMTRKISSFNPEELYA